MAPIERLSLNQMTLNQWSLREAVEGCVRHGIQSIAVWRHKIEDEGLESSVRVVRGAGLHVSSVCRGGMFAAPDEADRRKRMEDNFRAVDEAAAFAADALVLVVGPANGMKLDEARSVVRDAVCELVEYAHPRGVKLALEPLHPMFAADRSVLLTLDQAYELAAMHEPAAVGLIVDVYHVWWDPKLYQLLAKIGNRILGFHVSDWITPLPDVLLGRGMMGDGVIEIKRIREAVETAGYHGPIEVEIFNQKIWDSPGDEILDLMLKRFQDV